MRYYFSFISIVFIINFHFLICSSKIVDYEKNGAVSDDDSYETSLKNGQILNSTLNTLQSGDTLYISDKTFHLVGGILADGLKNIIIIIDGTLSFTNDRETWPTKSDGSVLECIYLTNVENMTLTSNGIGTLDGNGKEWWGAINFLKHQENRPRLWHVKKSKNVLIENILFKDSPYWTCYMEESDGLEIRNSEVSARWTDKDYHTLLDLQAFNTDGFDVTGRNVYIHDTKIWCQDDCISVKDGSENMLFERINCSGLGLVVGSIGSSVVNNITFRDSIMPSTVKGIYMKTRWSDLPPAGIDVASISNVLFENILIDKPQQFGIWIGPAQQTGQPCSLLWPILDKATCLMSGYQTWSNITLKNIQIKDPEQSPGVLMGNVSNPIRGLVFDNVHVTNPGKKPWGDEFYYCQGIDNGLATGVTNPVPPCFTSTK